MDSDSSNIVDLSGTALRISPEDMKKLNEIGAARGVSIIACLWEGCFFTCGGACLNGCKDGCKENCKDGCKESCKENCQSATCSSCKDSCKNNGKSE